mmetsp:Transcript_30009/g.50746  ORF Transcript_30009/g.50746 Transcript_30009/m.50746 type:complete len:207 (-) Transcript_30009:247-867(-)
MAPASSSLHLLQQRRVRGGNAGQALLGLLPQGRHLRRQQLHRVASLRQHLEERVHRRARRCGDLSKQVSALHTQGQLQCREEALGRAENRHGGLWVVEVLHAQLRGLHHFIRVAIVVATRGATASSGAHVRTVSRHGSITCATSTSRGSVGRRVTKQGQDGWVEGGELTQAPGHGSGLSLLLLLPELRYQTLRHPPCSEGRRSGRR